VFTHLGENDVEAGVEGVVNSNLEIGSQELDTSSTGLLGIVLAGKEVLGIDGAVAVLACGLLVLRACVLRCNVIRSERVLGRVCQLKK